MVATLRSRWLVVAATGMALVGAGGVWALTRSSATTPTAATTALVAATTGTLQQTVSTTGTLQPAKQAVLSFTVSGSVTSVPAAVGERVGKGAVLATVDPTALQVLVTTATAGVTAAEQQLASVASATSAQVTAAQAQLAAARSTLVAAQAGLAAASLRAPFAGVVAAVGLTAGDVVGSSGGSRSGAASSASGGSGVASSSSTGSITVITTDSWIVDATVGSADLPNLVKGLQATITPSGGATVFGTIASVGIVASSTSGGTATFPVVVGVTGSPAGLYGGATADVSLIIKQIRNALTVPTSAVQTANGNTVVYRHVGTQRVATPVMVGASYGPTTQILAGLKDGDQVEVPLGRGGGRSGTRRGGTGGGGTGNGGGFGGAGGFTGGAG
jgi:multidrug efflux pump subunit AcrA (membrane-fusion protein)